MYGADVGETAGFSVVGSSLGKEADGVGAGDFEGKFVVAADGCKLGNANGLAVGFKSDGLELTDGSTHGCRMGDADGALLGHGDSVGSSLPVTVGLGESVCLAVGTAEGEIKGRSKGAVRGTAVVWGTGSNSQEMI